MTSSILADIVKAISHQPEVTARNWVELGPDRVVRAMDGEFFRSLAENHVDALAFDALHLLGWDMRISPYIVAFLKRRVALNEAVFEAHYEALAELSDLVGPIIAEAMIPKGALLAEQYSSLGHRRMTDFDLNVPADLLDELGTTLLGLGYEVEPGGFGKDYVKRIGPLWSWRDRIAMHVFPRKPVHDGFAVKGKLRDVPCLLPTPELQLVLLLLNAQEHASSFTFASYGADLQHIRAIDIELVVEHDDVDPLGLWRVITELGVETQAALGMHAQRRLRGELPAGWEIFKPVIDAVDPVADLVAMPDGRIARWPVGGQERVFHPNRTDVAVGLLTEEQRGTEWLTGLRRSLYQEDEPADKILDRARPEVLAAAAAIGR
jgi:hypothetical protein